VTLEVRYDVAGAHELVRRMEALSDAMAERVMERAARSAGEVVVNEWKRTFRKKSEQSVAGLPPRVQSGTYRRAIHLELVSHSRTRVEVVVGPSIIDPPYPAYLEYGTSRMSPHPIARPAWDRSKVPARDEATRQLSAALGL
jgi:HK97 gp10 family phage protein